GKYLPGKPPPSDSRAASPEMNGFVGRWNTGVVLDAVARLRPVAQGAGLSLAQLALAWVLRKRSVASAIIGATKPAQVAENAAAAGKELPDDVLRAVDAAVADAVLSR